MVSLVKKERRFNGKLITLRPQNAVGTRLNNFLEFLIVRSSPGSSDSSQYMGSLSSCRTSIDSWRFSAGMEGCSGPYPTTFAQSRRIMIHIANHECEENGSTLALLDGVYGSHRSVLSQFRDVDKVSKVNKGNAERNILSNQDWLLSQRYRILAVHKLFAL